MAVCKCGEKAFTFTKYSIEGKHAVSKCGSFKDTKKGPCDFFETVFTSTIHKCTEMETSKIETRKKKDTKESKLNKFITYYELCVDSNLPTDNVVANIDHLLTFMGYKIFNTDFENIKDLKKRLRGNPDRSVVPPPIKKYTITEVPEHLGVFRIKKSKKKKMKMKMKSKDTVLIQEENGENSSDEEPHSENEEDNSFDIEKCDSDDDSEDFAEDDTGNFSD